MGLASEMGNFFSVAFDISAGNSSFSRSVHASHHALRVEAISKHAYDENATARFAAPPLPL